MIRAIIIDDEKHNVINLQHLLEQHCHSVSVIGTAGNADAGIYLIERVKPDLVFLDIQMPGKTGFDMLKQLPEHAFELIFVTAHDQYGIQAVKFAAMDYLLKPLDIAELKQAVERAGHRILGKKQYSQFKYLATILEQDHRKEDHRIALPGLKEIRFVFTKAIVRCESANSYTHFFMQDGEKITVAIALIEYEEMLSPYGFVRCHQSHLVNKRFVKSIVKENGGYVLLQDGTPIPMSRQKREQLRSDLL